MVDRIPFLALTGISVLLCGAHLVVPFGLTDIGAITISILILTVACLLYRAKRDRREAEQARLETVAIAEQHRRAADELRNRNNWLRMTEALAHVGHWRLDLTDDSLFWSDETYAIHGWSRDRQPKLEDALSVYHEDDRAHVAEAVETARETGRPYTFRARLVRPDGEIRHVEAVAKTQLDEMGDTTALFGVFADRTDEFHMRQALVEAGDKAFSAANAKTTFLATMSHEIRTPMNGLVGFADLLLRSDLPEREHQFAEMIAGSARAMTLLLNDILDISKIEAGELSVKQEPTDISHVIEHVARLVEPEVREKGLQLELDVAPSVPRSCLTDPLRLRQILSNLVGNAVKFTERGFISIKAECREGALVVVVQDSGIGIAEKDREQIFDAFAQADAMPSYEKGGTGLGLAISRQLAELLGGTLILESSIGEGSSFTVNVPVTAIAAQMPAERANNENKVPTEKPGNDGLRVLVAEDYDINQMLVQAMADQAGIEVALAEDGEVAVAMAERAEAEGKPFSMVMMDLQMPNMDGYEAVRQLRANGFDAERLPIVAMTANAFPEDLEKCLEVGMQAHLAKPVSFEDFRKTIEQWSAPAIPKAA